MINREVIHSQLEMKQGTANHKLRTIIMFNLVVELGRDICFRCGKMINSHKEFSIDHKEPWLHNDSELFWDFNNIAFSHKSCNSSAARTPLVGSKKPTLRRKCIDGKFVCPSSNELLDRDKFQTDNRKFYKISTKCKSCKSVKKS